MFGKPLSEIALGNSPFVITQVCIDSPSPQLSPLRVSRPALRHRVRARHNWHFRHGATGLALLRATSEHGVVSLQRIPCYELELVEQTTLLEPRRSAHKRIPIKILAGNKARTPTATLVLHPHVSTTPQCTVASVNGRCRVTTSFKIRIRNSRR